MRIYCFGINLIVGTVIIFAGMVIVLGDLHFAFWMVNVGLIQMLRFFTTLMLHTSKVSNSTTNSQPEPYEEEGGRREQSSCEWWMRGACMERVSEVHLVKAAGRPDGNHRVSR